MLTVGLAAVGVALGQVYFGPLFLADRDPGATGLLFGSGLFTIAFAAIVSD